MTARTLLTLIASILRRQPFQTFLPTLLLRETFTVDLLNGVYVLESKAGFSDSREVIHTLTLGYQPPSPFVSAVKANYLPQHLAGEVGGLLMAVFSDPHLYI